MKKIILLLALLTVSLVSCTIKDNSPVYVETTKVYNRFFTVSPSQWVKAENPNSWYVTLNDGDITSDVIDYGAVLIYIKDANNAWVPLPFTKVSKTASGITFSEEISAAYSLGRVDVDYKYDNPNDPTPLHTPLYVKVSVLDDRQYYSKVKSAKTAEELESLKLKYNVEEINLDKPGKGFISKGE